MQRHRLQMGSARSSISLYANAAESQPSSRDGTGQTWRAWLESTKAVALPSRLPFLLQSDGTVGCLSVSQAAVAAFFCRHEPLRLNLYSSFFSALVWGSSVKHNPQKVGKDHVMEDEDVIQLVKK